MPINRVFFLILLSFIPIIANSQTIQLPNPSDTISYFDPIADYYKIENEKNVKKDSLINSKNINCLKQGYKNYFNQITNVKQINYNLFKDTCALKELNLLFNFLAKNSLKEIPRLNCLDNVLDSFQVNYALISLSRGFYRSKENYNKEMRKGVLLGALSLGTYVSVPNESAIDLIVLLLNVKTRQIIIYKESKMIECSPDNQKDINTQIIRVFKSTFKKKKI